MKIIIEKTDYEDKRIVECLPKNQRGIEFRLRTESSTDSCGGPISREQLARFRDEIDKILRTSEKPKYTIMHDSSIQASVVIERY